MKSLTGLVFTVFAAFPALASGDAPAGAFAQWQAAPETIFDAVDVNLADFAWRARPVVVFADTAADARYTRQIELLEARLDALAERDVVVIVDTDPAAMSALRQKLRPRGFMLTLIGKDGQVKLRKPLPWDVRELSRVIDKMPMRQQEIEDRRGE